MLYLTQEVLNVAQKFNTVNDKLFGVAFQVCDAHATFWRAVKVDVTSEYTAIDKFRRFIGVYRQDLWKSNGYGKRLADDDPLQPLQVSIDKASDSVWYIKHIGNLVERTITGGGSPATQLSRELGLNETNIPNAIRPMIAAAKKA